MNKFLILLLISTTMLAQESYLLDINRVRMPFNNTGVLANLIVNGEAGGKLDGKQFLFEGGFFLSGKNADTIWANGVQWISDYQPGNVDSIFYDPRYGIYDVQSTSAFGYKWQKWRYAVDIGADFYDGDGDGIYNPVDLNGNNTWDPNEDRPDIISNSLTTWCVYNDGVPSSQRRFSDASLRGIEIHQTLFAFEGLNNNDARRSTFFVRYKIINTGKVNSVLDSVFFAIWTDTDIGGGDGYLDDLSGCDTMHNSGYIYNDGEDPDWGIDPPAHFIKILQGPFAYIPGETFIDQNSNGIYDEGIDTPLDSAYNYKGYELGIDTLPGAKNLGMTSFISYPRNMVNTEPDNQIEAYNFLRGLKLNGENYDPCTWPFGQVVGGINCNEVNPVYMYSGDPVVQYGWLNTLVSDYRQLPSTGPFKLEVEKPVNIIVAHIAGRGTDALNSITVSRNYSEAIQAFYESNFTNIPVSVEDGNPELNVNKFDLYQNYPNPFNPTTIIRYSIQEFSKVTLKVYDVLGNEVATLVDEEKSIGNYEVVFDGNTLSSGVYFYQLRAGDFIQTKQMILLK